MNGEIMPRSFAETNIGKLSFEFIESKVCEIFTKYLEFEVTPNILKTNSRKTEIAYCRFTCMYIAKTYNKDVLLKDIGAYYHKDDHTTVMNGIEKITEILEGVDSKMKFRKKSMMVDAIKESIKFINLNSNNGRID